MPSLPPTRPYLLRALHAWCCDNGFTPCIAVHADASVQVPREFVKDGHIVLNISPGATHRLELGNDCIRFQARFGGRVRDILVPQSRVLAIYARENGQGMRFPLPQAPADDAEGAADAMLAATPPAGPPPDGPAPGGGSRPALRRIK